METKLQQAAQAATGRGTGNEKAKNRRAGESTEADLIQRIDGLAPVADTNARHYDAVVTDTITSSQIPLVGELQLERGRRIEIKSAMVRYASGKRGMFYFRPVQHNYLEDVSGMYALAVCEPTPSRDILGVKMVPTDAIRATIEDGWMAAADGHSEYAQRAWSNFFNPEEIEVR